MTTQNRPYDTPPDTLRVIVCGGRDYADAGKVRAVIKDVAGLADRVTIVHGAARGADTLAGDIAAFWGLTVEAHPAEWDKHGKGAGPIRNQKMLDAGADLVVAFPGGAGTSDMVGRAEAAGVPVWAVT